MSRPEKPRGFKWLFVLAVAAPAAEAIILEAFGFVSALPLAPQISAPAPFGAFHDLRWVWTYAFSWPSVAWQLVALLVFRSLFDAVLIASAWPREASRPSFLILWRRSVVYGVIAIVVMSPWATFTFAAGMLSYGWFMVAAIIASLLTALVMPAGIITGEWWRRILPWRTMPHVILAWLSITLAALAITFSPPWFTVVIAAAAGWLNAVLWRRIVASAIKVGVPRHTIPVAPLAIIAVVGLFVAGGGYLYGMSRQSGRKRQQGAAEIARATRGQAPSGQPIIFVNGFGSSYDGRRYRLFGSRRRSAYFSYNGLGPNGRPRAYSAVDTRQSLAISARFLATQIDRLNRRFHQSVTVIAESEGTMVARLYFATHPNAPVDRYIQTSPLIRPSRVYYPPAGDSGFGLVAGWEAREILHLARLENPSMHIHADMPFLRSMVERAPLLRDQTLCPVPGVRNFMFIPLQGAMMAERGPLARIPWAALPGWHATLLVKGTVERDLRHLLKTGQLRKRTGWTFAFDMIRGAGAAWQSPALPLRFSPWRAASGSDPAFGGYRCGSTHLNRLNRRQTGGSESHR
jgi:hypothetical protein